VSEKDRKSIRVSAGKLQTSIRGIRSLPQRRRVAKETKED